MLYEMCVVFERSVRMNTINNNSLSFQAKFKKLPVKIEAKQLKEAFKVPNPWAKGEMLEGKAGDSLVTNLLNGERYPIQPEVLKQKYEHISGNLYQTRMDKEVLIEADLPKALEILSREGAEKHMLMECLQWKLLTEPVNHMQFPEIIL